MPLSPSETRAVLERLGRRPNKRLGQNFLVDGNIVRKSLELADVQPGDCIVEVGPGLGTLSSALLEAGAEVWAVELDPELHANLAATLAVENPEKFHLLHGDAVDHPRASFALQSKFKIVANLPYAISTPWMEKILAGPLPERLVLMLQKEAADRFTAAPGQKNYGAISIFIEAAYQRRPGHRVSRQCFYPAPDVDSTLLHLERLPDAFFFNAAQREVIRSIFTQRRKQIGSLVNKHERAEELRPWLAQLVENGIPETTRPEAIPLFGWKLMVFT
ncbi:16S rRNA (adenine(1518)-N(6)/adenine(1519)-N(6))-dimethyltransferase RsmA [Cerasicoccus maritimus]|uniref:16S rRNA (adenine(1518)-N(6)/adenine(1519)-N(6))- dimethyltransferase RsmA n=1 Tax=Cerasicoccus maritimus TaxID=490089 RepID=UPI0028529F2D|nr:16S rRNA (adenine(1518)-N(6)/adenine(1519)-N(6))-dimethyltransferase RsmA [Cerasicoccus maritimus]